MFMWCYWHQQTTFSVCVCVLVACSVQELRRMPGQGFLAWQSMTSATGNGVKRTGKDWQTTCKHPFAIVSICYSKFCCNPYTHAIQKQVEIRQSQSFILAVYDRLSPKYLLPAMNPNHGERGNSRYNQRAFCCRHLLAHCSWAHTFFECPSISFHPSNELSSCIQSSQCSRTAGDGQSEWKDQSIHGWTQGLNELSCLQLQWNLPPMAVMNTYEHQKLWEQSRGHWDVMMFHKDSDCDPWSCVKELWWKRLVVRRQAICSCPWKMISRNFHQNWCFSGW